MGGIQIVLGRWVLVGDRSLPWVGSDHQGGCGAIGAHGWSWLCSPWVATSLGFCGCGRKWVLFGFVDMDLAVMVVDGGGGGGGVGCDCDCDCDCDYGGGVGWLWVVVEVASFDCWCVVVDYICGCGRRER